MADFVQTMKDWRRMCKHYSDESKKDGQHSCVDMCPLGHNTACGIIEDALDSDIEVTAKEIAKWAEEHPEPQYETWLEFVKRFETGEPKSDKDFIYWMGTTSIPADIAEKLAIEPKEGT